MAATRCSAEPSTTTSNSGAGRVEGLGLLPVDTVFDADKVTTRCAGTGLGHDLHGYQIHHGRVRPDGGAPFVELDGTVDGVRTGRCCGTTVHGLFENDGFRRAFLTEVAARRGKRFVPGAGSYAAARETRLDRLADTLEAHLDLDAVTDLIAAAGRGASSPVSPR